MRISQKMGIYNNMGISLDPVFANNDWESIIIACQQNIVPDTWAVGDSKDMIIGSETYPIDIIGKNHDTYSSGGTAPLTLQMHNSYSVRYPMNATATNAVGWSGSQMRLETMPSFLQLLPSEVQAGIKNVSKITSVGNYSTSLKTTSDGLFLLSKVEVTGPDIASTTSVPGEGTHYEYFVLYHTEGRATLDSGIIYNGNWARSPFHYSGSTNALNTQGYVIIYDATSNGSGTAANNTWPYMAPAFCF